MTRQCSNFVSPPRLDVVSNGTKMWLVCICRFSGPMTTITSFFFFLFFFIRTPLKTSNLSHLLHN